MFASDWKRRYRTYAIAAALVLLVSAGFIERGLQHLTWGADILYWVVFGASYKRELALQAFDDREFQHVLWRDWGFAGSVESYLVYDPLNRLEHLNGGSGIVAGVPCPIYDVNELASHYYTVTLPVDNTWDFCPESLWRRMPGF